MGMTKTQITLTGSFGIAVTAPLALASLKREDGIVATYGVGTTADPDLTGEAWSRRAELERAANPFTR